MIMHIRHDEEYYRSRIPQPDLGPLRNFLRFVWNGEAKMLFGRTGGEWAQLGFFYLCFFTVLGLIFALQLWISIDYASKLEKPFFLYNGLASRSFFGNNFPLFRRMDFGNPGIGFKPNILLPTISPIIWVDNSSMNTQPEKYVHTLTDFLQEYNKSRENYRTTVECSDKLSALYDVKPCFFDIASLGVCGKPPYGYTNPLQPCILIKFNKRFDWIPIHYNSSSQLPESMPRPLQEIVQTSNKIASKYIAKPAYIDLLSGFVSNFALRSMYAGFAIKTQAYCGHRWHRICLEFLSEFDANLVTICYQIVYWLQIWLWCDGVNSVDKDHVGEIEYLPSSGFPVRYFPFVGQSDYLSPMVALRFKNITPGRLVTVECNLWALNINEDRQNALDFQIILGEL